jgi:prepilin-type N-terminal cleavage/methylation domain-containing protein
MRAMKDFRRAAHARHAFTLLELMTVIVVVCILAVMVFSSVAALRGKAERGRCVNNLHGLYAAGVSYMTDHESWPQIPVADIEDPNFARAWMDAFAPYHIGRQNWTCATIQKLIGDPPEDPNAPRIDYIPTRFDNKPNSPWLYPTHPWFVERADTHGDGNLIIFANGQVHSANSLQEKR